MKTAEATSWVRDPGLPFQTLDEDTIVVDPRSREVHLLNETAARVWELLSSPGSIDSLAAVLVEEYEAPLEEVRSSVEALVRELGDKGILRPA